MPSVAIPRSSECDNQINADIITRVLLSFSTFISSSLSILIVTNDGSETLR